MIAPYCPVGCNEHWVHESQQPHEGDERGKMKEITIQRDSLGRQVGLFNDRHSRGCVIQENLITDEGEPCIRLGPDLFNQQMLLTREHVAVLIPLLQKFVETGELS